MNVPLRIEVYKAGFDVQISEGIMCVLIKMLLSSTSANPTECSTYLVIG